MGSQHIKATLVVKSGSQNGTAYDLTTEQTLLGRLQPCDIVLPSSGVSRQHARVTRREDGYVIEDLGSLNGTFVNAERLQGMRLLADDDQIQIHDTLLSFQAESPRPTDDAGATDGRDPSKSNIHTSVVAALDVRMGGQSRVEVNAEIKLRALLAIIHSAGEAHGTDQALVDVLDHVFEIFPQASHGFVLLYETPDAALDAPSEGTLVPRAIKHRQANAAECTLGPINNQIAFQAMESGQAILSADISDPHRQDPSATVFDIQVRAIMCTPWWPRRARNWACCSWSPMIRCGSSPSPTWTCWRASACSSASWSNMPDATNAKGPRPPCGTARAGFGPWSKRATTASRFSTSKAGSAIRPPAPPNNWAIRPAPDWGNGLSARCVTRIGRKSPACSPKC